MPPKHKKHAELHAPDAPPTEPSPIAEAPSVAVEAPAATVAPSAAPAPAPEPPEGSRLYKDNAGPPRLQPESEGKLNFGTVTQNAIDAVRGAQEG